MLAFYNNFLSKQVHIIVDHVEDKSFLLIQKCGTKSLLNLTLNDPKRFSSQIFNVLDFPFETVQVFLRNPIERFITGLQTQIQIYGLNSDYLNDMINHQKIIHFFDSHTSPQFWFLLKFGIESKIKFKLRELSDLNTVFPNIEIVNKNTKPLKFDILPIALERINHFLTEDIVLYNNFLNQTVLLKDIIQKIKQETDFVRDMQQYHKEVNYLFTY